MSYGVRVFLTSKSSLERAVDKTTILPYVHGFIGFLALEVTVTEKIQNLLEIRWVKF